MSRIQIGYVKSLGLILRIKYWNEGSMRPWHGPNDRSGSVPAHTPFVVSAYIRTCH